MKGIALIQWDIPKDYYNEDSLTLKDCRIILKYKFITEIHFIKEEKLK